MNHLPIRIWFMATVALFLSAVIVRLIWEITTTTAVGSLVIIILLILVTLGIYALLLYLTIKPSLKKLKNLPVAIWVTVMFTAGLIGALIHFVRFVPSPEAAAPLSVIIASMLIMAAISIYLLVLWVIWFTGKD